MSGWSIIELNTRLKATPDFARLNWDAHLQTAESSSLGGIKK